MPSRRTKGICLRCARNSVNYGRPNVDPGNAPVVQILTTERIVSPLETGDDAVEIWMSAVDARLPTYPYLKQSVSRNGSVAPLAKIRFKPGNSQGSSV